MKLGLRAGLESAAVPALLCRCSCGTVPSYYSYDSTSKEGDNVVLSVKESGRIPNLKSLPVPVPNNRSSPLLQLYYW